jgi:hypothetical protein
MHDIHVLKEQGTCLLLKGARQVLVILPKTLEGLEMNNLVMILSGPPLHVLLLLTVGYDPDV